MALTERRQGVVRTAANLLSSTVITAGLGVVFWAVAARTFSPEAVGEGNAVLSAATLLALVAQLSLGSICTRFVPRAGRYTGWILRRIYLAVIVTAISVGLMAALAFSNPGTGGPVGGALFVLGVLSLSLFAIQDQALLGLGRSGLIPVENTIFSIAKIVLLPVLVSITVVSGIFLAWILSAAASVGVVSSYLFGRVVPAHERSPESLPLPPRRQLRPLLVSQFVASVASQFAVLAVPIVVTARIGAEQNGYLAVAWLVVIAFAALLSNISQSFCYHVRAGEAITSRSLRRLIAMMVVAGGGGGLVVVIAAPLILGVIAPGYQEIATPALRLIGVAMPFLALRSLWSTFMWLEHRLWSVSFNFVMIGVGTLGITYVLAPAIGITSAGLALLVSNAVAGVVALPAIVRRIALVRSGQGSRWIKWDDK